MIGVNGVIVVIVVNGLKSGIPWTLGPKKKNNKNNYMNLLLTGYECKPVKKEYERLDLSNCRSFSPDDTPEPEWQIQKNDDDLCKCGKKGWQHQKSEPAIHGKNYWKILLPLVLSNCILRGEGKIKIFDLHVWLHAIFGLFPGQVSSILHHMVANCSSK